MHFKDDPISDMHAKKYVIILCPKHFPGRTKFGPVFWSRLFRRGPVVYNYPLFHRVRPLTFRRTRIIQNITKERIYDRSSKKFAALI